MLWASLVLLQASQTVIDPSVELGSVSSSMYGSCIEDVNHEIYGGIYAQTIFGESFEEPPAGLSPKGWKVYGGDWVPDGNGVHVSSGPGFKLVTDSAGGQGQEIEADVAIANDFGTNAGFLLRVSGAGVGADQFDGYEVSFSPREQRVILGKHEHDFHQLAEAPAVLASGRWHHLRAQADGGRIRVFLDREEKPRIDFVDPHPLSGAEVALRTWHSDASFRDVRVGGFSDGFNWSGAGTSPRWDVVRSPGGHGALRFERDGYNGTYAQHLICRVAGERIGIANRGLNRWGIACRKRQVMAGGIALKGDAVPVTIALQSADGSRTYAMQKLTPSTAWKYARFSLTPSETDANCRLAIWIDQYGEVGIDQVELMQPKSKLYHGLPLRADIVTELKRSGVTFLRYGGTMVNTQNYRWKNMIGPREHRPPYVGHWNSSSTNGFGIFDFLDLCEAAGFGSAFAINAEESPADVSDLADYLFGPATSTWGRRRVANGHPKPYKVDYIEIGNEECLASRTKETYGHYAEQFARLADAIHARYSDVKLVCAAWWLSDSPLMQDVFRAIDGKAAAWDIHVGGDDPASGFQVEREISGIREKFRSWNPNSTMKTVIFEENGGTHSLRRGLGHATNVNAARRLGDFVLVDCAANCLQPVQQNDNGWDQGQVFFDPSRAWQMPPAVVNQLLQSGHQPVQVAATTDSGLDVFAAKSRDGKTVCVTLVNIKNAPVRTKLSFRDSVFKSAVMRYVSGDLGTVNSPGVNRIPILTRNLPLDRLVEMPAYAVATIEMKL
ncbi:MAG: DUF1080 domain-containing protein [Armatimonadetes bacterium]|nr:DUF1080 domain-containing protein [Armatimonadota bacterium]